MPTQNIGWDALDGVPSESRAEADSEVMDSVAHLLVQLHAALDAIVLLVAEVERIIVAARVR